MTGDQQDMMSRLRDALPLRWFPDNTPVLDAVLKGLGSAWACLYDLIQYVRVQARIETAQGIWLDVAARDFFGARVRRSTVQGDERFRLRIRQELVRERGTRQALQLSIVDLTGRPPRLFEPANPMDTGGYGGCAGVGGGVAYGKAGGWGNLNLPFQCFVTAYRPCGSGVAVVVGWGGFGGAYGAGAIEYANSSMIEAQVTDRDINTAIVDVLPIGVICWTRISS